jgi:hypothetical protein
VMVGWLWVWIRSGHSPISQPCLTVSRKTDLYNVKFRRVP